MRTGRIRTRGFYNPRPSIRETDMKISMYEASIPTFIHSLGNLKVILQKAVQYAETRKFDPNVLTTARLFPDMLPFTRQI